MKIAHLLFPKPVHSVCIHRNFYPGICLTSLNAGAGYIMCFRSQPPMPETIIARLYHTCIIHINIVHIKPSAQAMPGHIHRVPPQLILVGPEQTRHLFFRISFLKIPVGPPMMDITAVCLSFLKINPQSNLAPVQRGLLHNRQRIRASLLFPEQSFRLIGGIAQEITLQHGTATGHLFFFHKQTDSRQESFQLAGI